LLLLLCTAACAQTKMGRYHKNLLYEADLYFLQGDYYYASELYTELLKVEPDNPELISKLGVSLYQLPTMRNRASQYLELAAAADNAEAMLYLARIRHGEHRFYEALELVDRYTAKSLRTLSDSDVRHFRKTIERAIQQVQAPALVTIANMGDKVNSPAHDYAPVVCYTTEALWFTSRRRFDDKSEKDFTEQFDENIYSVDLSVNDRSAVPALSPLNSRTNDATVAVSADGTQLVVYRTSKDGLSGDLYITSKAADGWSELKKLDSNINTKHQEASACFGNDEATILYFSSDRNGGYGGKDLYVVQRLPDGSWGNPRNLGEPINTPYDDDAPFIDAKGNLYFASRGHESIGGFDIFVSQPEGDGWGQPMGLGYPINTPADDVFFTLAPDGRVAYFSSDRMGGFGLQDLYMVVFDESAHVLCHIEVEAEKAPATANMKVINEATGRIEGFYQAGGGNLRFVVPMVANHSYTLIVEADGYAPAERSLRFDPQAAGKVSETTEMIRLSAERP
jgi:tetratricopeptide (TPR) repeat protein